MLCSMFRATRGSRTASPSYRDLNQKFLVSSPSGKARVEVEIATRGLSRHVSLSRSRFDSQARLGGSKSTMERRLKFVRRGSSCSHERQFASAGVCSGSVFRRLFPLSFFSLAKRTAGGQILSPWGHPFFPMLDLTSPDRHLGTLFLRRVRSATLLFCNCCAGGCVNRLPCATIVLFCPEKRGFIVTSTQQWVTVFHTWNTRRCICATLPTQYFSVQLLQNSPHFEPRLFVGEVRGFSEAALRRFLLS